MKDRIVIEELEVRYRVGVPEEERAAPQRLLLTVAMEHGFDRAAASDDLTATIDYFAVCQRLLKFGDGKEWRLIEKLAVDVAGLVLGEFGPTAVEVTVKKFIIPEAKWVGVAVRREG